MLKWKCAEIRDEGKWNNEQVQKKKNSKTIWLKQMNECSNDKSENWKKKWVLNFFPFLSSTKK